MGEEPSALVPTPRYEKVLRMAEEEARRRGHLYVGVEHLMLAILAEDGSLPAQVLRGIGATAPFTDAIERTMASRAYGPPPDPAR